MRTILCRLTLPMLFAIAMPFYVSAQYASSKQKFGFKAGMNHTHMNFHRGYLPEGHSPLESTPQKSFNFGFLLNLPVTQAVSLQPEYLYTERKTLLTESGAQLKFQYLSLPVLLHLKVNNRVSIHGGPQVDLLIHATRKVEGKSFNITHDTEERNLGAVGGFRYLLMNNFFIEGRYMHGINNVGIGQRSDVSEFKYEVFEVCAGIKF